MGNSHEEPKPVGHKNKEMLIFAEIRDYEMLCGSRTMFQRFEFLHRVQRTQFSTNLPQTLHAGTRTLGDPSDTEMAKNESVQVKI